MGKTSKRKNFSSEGNSASHPSGYDVDSKQVVSLSLYNISIAMKLVHNFQLIPRLINANDIPRGIPPPFPEYTINFDPHLSRLAHVIFHVVERQKTNFSFNCCCFAQVQIFANFSGHNRRVDALNCDLSYDVDNGRDCRQASYK